MTRVQRAPWLSLRVEDGPVLDLGALLRGRLQHASGARLCAVSPFAEDGLPVSQQELAALLATPEEAWIGVDDVVARGGADRAVVEGLVDRGLLLSDADDDANRRRRSRSFAAGAWDRWAATYHFQGKWRRAQQPEPLAELPGSVQQAAPGTSAAFEAHCDRHGPPPPAFHQRPDADGSVDLPAAGWASPLRRLLADRETTRLFDRQRSLGLEDLGTVLDVVFGCRGTARLAPRLTVLKKTSPSGGALHPIEVYPLVRDVAGLEPGLYHYNVRTHRLDRLLALDPEAVEERIEAYSNGQGYFRSAHVVLVLAARFYRTFWKYRQHSKAYRVLFAEAGHLSQTLYLTATEMGLGGFFTAAVSEVEMEQDLGLDGVGEGALALCGCGVLRSDGPGMTLDTQPYDAIAAR